MTTVADLIDAGRSAAALGRRVKTRHGSGLIAAVNHKVLPTGLLDEHRNVVYTSVEVYVDGEIGRRSYDDPSKLELIDDGSTPGDSRLDSLNSSGA